MTNDPSTEQLNPDRGTGHHFSIRRLGTILISAVAWTCGLVAFILFGSLLLCIGALIDPKHFNGAVKAACRIILRCALIRVQVLGQGPLRPDRPYLFIANHVNIFDVLVLYGHIPNEFRGIELDEHFEWFFYGRIIRLLGMIPISQTNGRSALKSLERAQTALAGGTSILILPEGGRTLDGRLQPFKRGSFLLAKNARVDIVPTVMVGAFEIYRKGSRLIRPGKMTLRFGEPIAYGTLQGLDLSQMEACVRRRMLELLSQGNV